MPRLSNKEKSARRYTALTKIAEQFARENEAFRQFLIIKGEDESQPPTWRRLETFIKQQFEQGQRIHIVVESETSGN